MIAVYLILAGLLVSFYLISAFIPIKCNMCNKKLKRNETVYSFSANMYLKDSIVFSEYYKREYNIPPGYFDKQTKLCKRCYNKMKKRFDMIKSDEDRYYLKEKFIEAFFMTYLGDIPDSRQSEEYETRFYDNRLTAFEEMKKYAVHNDKDLLYDVRYIKQFTVEKNGYIHYAWQAIGNIARKI